MIGILFGSILSSAIFEVLLKLTGKRNSEAVDA